MTNPTEGKWIERACPGCGVMEPRQTYDIGSGPELACVHCEWCWGAEGQELREIDWQKINHEEWAKRGAPDEQYRDFPDHPLRDIPKVVLAAARKVMAGAAEWGSVDPEAADGLADAVVAELRPWLNVELPTRAPVPPHDVDDPEVRGTETLGVAASGATGPVGGAGGPEDAVGSEGVEGPAGDHAGEATGDEDEPT